MLQSIRVFGHFEKPVFLKLCKHTEIMNLPAGSYLFKIGDPDVNVFIVQQGLVNVFIVGADGAQISLKLVKTGESVTSLLSFTDVLTGHTSSYKTVSARAVEDSVVVKLPMSSFQEVSKEKINILISLDNLQKSHSISSFSFIKGFSRLSGCIHTSHSGNNGTFATRYFHRIASVSRFIC